MLRSQELDVAPLRSIDWLHQMDTSADIAIVGAGPAGSHLAQLLASSGRSVLLLDPKGAWEKPCGGGVTTRALNEYSFLLEDSRYPAKRVNRITIVSPSERRVRVKLKEPFAVYSRKALNGLLLDRAVKSGARFLREGVCDFSRSGDGWLLKTNRDGGRAGEWSARFLVGADGAASFTRRRLVGIFPARDLAVAFGYNVADTSDSGGDDEVIVRFPRDFTGYLWAFPRPGVMNFGVASKLGERTSDELRRILSDFVRDYYGGRMPAPERVSFFGAKIPTLDLDAWSGLRTAGADWALVGDAAGFADPITGEGIYYALKSADVLADAIREASLDVPASFAGVGAVYERLWRAGFGRELQHASYRLPQFYHGRFFGQVITDAMVTLARFHRGVRHILVNALMGEQSYVTLKRDLLRSAYRVI